ncbi:hypothetical protein CHU_1726 [Cytophaga hutchinsonii ATCC 33406]|uniref:Uncharacterized protein n=1 Tax=Cytophaga hutchinsonii (strain ATCC 33406 / DSM 1761 / CIP 103989 / NBRC 15051 / NCIMB 9469 / D465) TaxID=269798 RepID=A0A6N4SRH1_CYTH3|nr:hypothetical protein CHU_1726 [Cytophaga hutchinsonii ATCC 33406]SFX39345.1 hypothetical protein SAMN04487930_103316 [Cytophaga hutchinsonii ATCC 33406]
MHYCSLDFIDCETSYKNNSFREYGLKKNRLLLYWFVKINIQALVLLKTDTTLLKKQKYDTAR